MAELPTGWAKPERALFAHYFDMSLAICGSGWMAATVSVERPDGACRTCTAEVGATGGRPAHKHLHLNVTVFGAPQITRRCRCGDTQTEPFPEIEISTLEDLSRGVRRYLQPDNSVTVRDIPDHELDQAWSPGWKPSG